MTEGRILHLQRFSTEDGPGIRTTVFFKGCGLRCAWCHNPESLSPHVQVQWFANRCLGCLTCLSICPDGCLEMSDQGLVIDREKCQGCATCVENCPAGALEQLGRRITVDELVAELLKDRAYYEQSGGGVTISGGEPVLQPDFAERLLERLQAEGVATALDTCGLCSPQALDRLFPHMDLLLYDLKFIDPERHRSFTGQSNRLILENLLSFRHYQSNSARPIELWIRTPLIPGATASDDNIQAIGHFIAKNMDGMVGRWELCAFNNLCVDKYQRLGLTWNYVGQPLLSASELTHWETVARDTGVRPEIVVATGATSVESTAG